MSMKRLRSPLVWLYAVLSVCRLSFCRSAGRPPWSSGACLFLEASASRAGAACAVYRFLIAGRERKVNRLAALIGTQKRIPLDWMAQRLNCSRES